MLGLLSIFILISNILVSIKANCPKPEVLYPCKCSDKIIECKEDGEYNIKFIFQAISKSISSDSEKHFEKFSISNDKIEEFEDNLFEDITFKEIEIWNCPNLRRISANAFKSSVNTIEKIGSIIDSKIGENSNGYEIFKVLSSLNNLKSIQLYHHKIPAIPPNAFSNDKQNKLESIAFNTIGAVGMPINSAIKSIGNYAFSALTNLKDIDLYKLGIDFIAKHAFDFKNPSNQTLTIKLGNTALNGLSFESGVFLNSKRPIVLDFYVHQDADLQDKLHFLDEQIFAPFLRLNKMNKISLNRNPSFFHFACDCRSYWIVRDKAQFKGQLNLGIYCPRDEHFQGKSILEVDESLFSHCK